MREILVFSSSTLQSERLKKALQPYFDGEYAFVDRERNTRMRLLPHVKRSEFAIVDYDGDAESAFTFVNHIKTIAMDNSVPIIALSTQSDVPMLKRIMDAGCSDFVLKPYDMTNLVSRIQRLVEGASNKAVIMPSKETHSSTPSNESFSLEWQDALSVGVTQIDDDHRAIIDRFKSLYLEMREGKGHSTYKDHLAFLIHYVDEHFKREEMLQKQVGYPHRDHHGLLHDEFSRQVSLWIAKLGGIGSEGLDGDDQPNEDDQGLGGHQEEIGHQELIQLCLFFKDWLVRHILVEDRQLGEFIKANNTSNASNTNEKNAE